MRRCIHPLLPDFVRLYARVEFFTPVLCKCLSMVGLNAKLGGEIFPPLRVAVQSPKGRQLTTVCLRIQRCCGGVFIFE